MKRYENMTIVCDAVYGIEIAEYINCIFCYEGKLYLMGDNGFYLL